MQSSKGSSVCAIAKRRSALLVLSIALSTSACSSITFLAANARAAFGDYQSARDIAYGDLPRQQLDVYRPKHSSGLSKGALPVIVFVHGGGWESGSKENYRFVAASLTT